jgi:hypothetical protein
VEFALSNAAGTLSVNHDPAAVRTRGSWTSAESAELVAPFGARSVERPEGLGDARPTAASRPAPLALVTPGASAVSASSASMVAPAPPPPPEDAVTAAVRACMLERPRADNVTVLFRTILELEVSDEGVVQSARFNPPVLPDVNECAAPAIYRAHFARAGAVSIPIEFKN